MLQAPQAARAGPRTSFAPEFRLPQRLLTAPSKPPLSGEEGRISVKDPPCPLFSVPPFWALSVVGSLRLRLSKRSQFCKKKCG